jgi:glyoxylase-like metal-dependent hydrolase (beta-lactamase superfamily II)
MNSPMPRREFLRDVGLLAISAGILSIHTGCAGTGVALALQSHTGSASGVFDNTHIISGRGELIVVDAHVIKPDAQALADVVKQTGKTLKYVFITHPHPDHYAGLQVIKERFPDARIIATPSVVKDITATGSFALQAVQQKYGELAATQLILPESYDNPTLSLEGNEIRIVEYVGGEAGHQAALYVPGARAFISGDLVYNHVHLLLAEKQPDEWINTLNKIPEVGEIETLYAGHGANAKGLSLLAEMKEYINFFKATVAGSATADEARAKMVARYPDYRSADYLLVRSVGAYFPPA